MQEIEHYMLMYKRINNLEVIGYSYADFAGCADSQRFTSGYVFMLANEAISWRSYKQIITTSSTIYNEFIACYEAVGQTMQLRNFIPVLRAVDNISRCQGNLPRVPQTAGYDLKVLDTICSFQRQTAGEPYTS
jgi:hypothetical protein